MIITEKTVERNIVYKGRVLEYVVDTVELENGITSTREMVFHPGGVGVICIDSDGCVCLVKQFRKPYDEALLEIPAGKLDKGEDPLECGKRELLEETGYTAKNFISLGKFYPSVGYTNEVLHLFMATELTAGESNPDEEEFVDIERIHLSKLVEMVMSGEIKDGKTIAAVLKANEILKLKGF